MPLELELVSKLLLNTMSLVLRESREKQHIHTTFAKRAIFKIKQTDRVESVIETRGRTRNKEDKRDAIMSWK